MSYLKVTDLSSNNGNYVPGSYGEDIVIVKATQGVGYTSPTLATQVQQTVDNGRNLGLYHFYNGGNTPEDEAEYFYSVIAQYLHLSPIIVLDYEVNDGNNEENIKRFINKLSSHITAPVWLYGGAKYGQLAQSLDLPFWLAMYPYASSESSPATWEAPLEAIEQYDFPVSMWQFTTSGGMLDRSLFFGTTEQLDKLSVHLEDNSQPQPQPEQPQQSPVSITDYAQAVNRGEYGNGDDRKNALGGLYESVQSWIDYNAGVISYADLIDRLAIEVIAGDLGDGEERKALLGSQYDEVQEAVNNKL